MKAPNSSKIRVVPFCHRVLLQTNGSDGAEVITDIPLPEAESWGPHVEVITAHTLLEQRSANFKWKVVHYWTIDGILWSPFTDLFAFQNTVGQKIQTDFNDKAKLGLKMRYALLCAPETGFTTREQGFVTVALSFQFRT